MTAHRVFTNKPRILCIDDDPAISAAIRLRLREYEADVLTATDGADGLWMALNEHPDVIVTDLRMPNGEGDYVVECLQGGSRTAEIPVIALTGRRDPDLQRWMATLGVKHYLRKPFRFEKLCDALRDYIELRPCEAQRIG